jgi:hypothetical protein
VSLHFVTSITHVALRAVPARNAHSDYQRR